MNGNEDAKLKEKALDSIMYSLSDLLVNNFT